MFVSKKNLISLIEENNILKEKLFKLEKKINESLEINEQFLAHFEIEKKNKLIEEQLRNKDKYKSLFNPRDPDTWEHARDDVIVFIDGIAVYNLTSVEVSGERQFIKNYIFEKEWSERFKSDKHCIEKWIKWYKRDCIQPDSEPVVTIDGFHFSKAMLDMIGSWDYANLKKIASAMNYCIENNLKRYQYGQYFYDNLLPISKEFSDVYFHELREDRLGVDNDIYIFFQEICMEDPESMSDILNKSLYLADKPELKQKIIKNVKDYYDNQE